MANHHDDDSGDALASGLPAATNNYLTEAIEANVFIPACVQDDNEKHKLLRIAYSVRQNLQILQTSAAKICHEVYCARQVFKKSENEEFFHFVLANFFPSVDGSAVDTENNRARIRSWTRNGRLIDEYFQKSGLQQFDSFKKLTMSALSSLVVAPEEIAMQVLAAPGDITGAEINERTDHFKNTGSVVSADMEFISRQVKRAADSDELAAAHAAAEDLRERVRFLQASKVDSDKQLDESGDELIAIRCKLADAQAALTKALQNGASASVRSAQTAVRNTDSEEKAAKAKLDILIKQQQEIQQRVNAVSEQLQSGVSVVKTVAELRDDITLLLAKYPAALQAKLLTSDKRVAPLLTEISDNLIALANQLSPSGMAT